VPTYQYACTACEHRFEIVQKFTESSLTECPECAGRLRKLYGSVGVVFKGSGFYRTDSRAGEKSGDKSGDKSSEKAPAAASDSSSSTSSSSESKKPSESNSSSSTTSTTKPAKIAS
jgi:putative FmdB family regulatory protein